jgi:hypothetical protein
MIIFYKHKEYDYIISFSFRPGRELWTYDQGPLNVKNRWMGFDGNLPHGTLCFTGTRYSLIYFTISKVIMPSLVPRAVIYFD